MRISLLSTHDIGGGAHVAAHRIHAAFLKNGHQSQQCVAIKSSDDRYVKGPDSKSKLGWALIRPLFNNLPLYFYRHRTKEKLSLALLPSDTVPRALAFKPDIVNLHWIADGFLRIPDPVRFARPIVWTLHDMWPFTGGCHYDQECNRFREACGQCPLLGSKNRNDLTRKTLRQKQSIYRRLNLQVVAPSRWMAQCAQASTAFKDVPVHTIPYPIDLERFKPRDKAAMRELLGLPQDKKLILFSAINSTHNDRKGFFLLNEALQTPAMLQHVGAMECVILGAPPQQPLADLQFKLHFIGHLHDQVSLAAVYAAVDLFVAPSLQDNLPNTVIESLACGTPAAAFDIGGMPDMIKHKQNGYLASPMDADNLAEGILWSLESKDR